MTSLNTVPAYVGSPPPTEAAPPDFEKAFDGEPDSWPSAPSVATTPVRLTFTGRGRDYFSLWLTNWILAILTLGIYSAWAKVLRLQYVHQNTQLAGYAFGFHGEPTTILYGRMIAVILLTLSYLGDFFQEIDSLVTVSTVVSLMLFLAFPWLIRSSMRFYSRNSSYRNVRFSFKGDLGELYVIYILGLLLTVFTLGLGFPYLAYRVRRYHIENNHWGNNRFSFNGTKGVFFGVYFVNALIGITVYFVIITAIASIISAWDIDIEKYMPKDDELTDANTLFFIAILAAGFLFFVIYRISTTITQGWLFKISWNHTQIDNSRFSCDLPVFKMYLIRWFCFIFSLITFGFFAPFAQMIITRARLSSISFIPAHDLDLAQAAFDADTTRSAEVADMLDFDISW